MRCQLSTNLGELLRQARERHGLSQRRLALRAGTSQDAISRIERGVESPTFERFAQLMLAIGERLQLTAEPLEAPVSAEDLAAAAAMTPSERLREAASWNRVASQLALAGREAREAGHPATRLGGS
ncbi:MAG TPA: helix-turn-helix transcriptional regulator [Solirubrobacterales bacterium]